ncbi:RNA polymerase sigma factor [Portibacter lacus]|uniref:DNA-directed RNA polymerase sigma-70 factor n=1 Tax=Portibacter lacus TaxID=1099794 RepID=A0AA37SQ98_9BACT|nr:sigma-70 family RNA polymerase sigma factor [Portibacter lacus]GLR17349.1 DNA-directed RNA polymerase sigma-70 factor [Portibacter lacus]
MEEQYISLIQKHEGIIHKVIGLYVDNDEDRKDMHQEILLQSWKSYANFKEDSTFSTWLYKVSLNTALTFRKKEDKRKLVSETPITTTSSESKEDYEMLYFLIKQLNEVDRMLMTLHLDGYKNQEIAEITGMTSNHINVKIHRLKATIIDQLKKANNGHI